LSKGLFITGTDTNIGKTIISASLTWKLSQYYDKICIMKPFATSDKIFSKKFNSKDLFLLSKSIKLMEDQKQLNPYFYKLPASPFMASKILKMRPPSIHLAFKKFEYLKKKYDFIVVEGIGGMMVPLNQKYNLVDFIKLTQLSVIIVSTPKIGTVNHILLTVRLCKDYGIPIKGIIFNKMPCRPSIVEKKTPFFIEKLINLPILGIIPYYKNIKFDEATFKKISDRIKYFSMK
jgi:dethiobiotin synthetase